MSESHSRFTELDELLAAADKLPVCDGSAKLHALVVRVVDALGSGADAVPAADALASAATQSLATDPWVQFEAAARAFRSAAARHDHAGARPAAGPCDGRGAPQPD